MNEMRLELHVEMYTCRPKVSQFGMGVFCFIFNCQEYIEPVLTVCLEAQQQHYVSRLRLALFNAVAIFVALTL
jgi:hypothetical protein